MITSFIENGIGFSEFCSKELEEELRSARIMNSYKLPCDVVRIYSKVKIQELEDDKPFSIQIVRPGQGNPKENKVSILAPLAAALIGYKKGDTVKWEVPSGIKRFRILEVEN